MTHEKFDELTGDEQDDIFEIFLMENPTYLENPEEDDPELFMKIYEDPVFFSWLETAKNI